MICFTAVLNSVRLSATTAIEVSVRQVNTFIEALHIHDEFHLVSSDVFPLLLSLFVRLAVVEDRSLCDALYLTLEVCYVLTKEIIKYLLQEICYLEFLRPQLFYNDLKVFNILMQFQTKVIKDFLREARLVFDFDESNWL